MWISRVCELTCFVFVSISALLTLVLLHVSGEAETNSFLVSSPTFSENLAYFEPLHADMPKMDTLAEMFVRQYIVARHTVIPDKVEMQIAWSPAGVVAHMSAPMVYDRFYTTTARAFLDLDMIAKETTEVDMKRIIKDGWNNWQVFFDTRTIQKLDDPPKIRSWIATIQFRYYSGRAVMQRRLRNPLGFTVMQYNIAEQKR